MQSHCRLDLTSPMPGCDPAQHRRHLLLESDLKLKEGMSSKVSECIFICEINQMFEFLAATRYEYAYHGN